MTPTAAGYTSARLRAPGGDLAGASASVHPDPGSALGRRPPRYELAVVTWLATYPTITVILASFKPVELMALPLPVRTLVLTAIMVPTVAFVLVPLLSRALGRWLRR